MLSKILRSNLKTKRLNNIIQKQNSFISPEDYLFNQRDASLATTVQDAKLLPLPLSNHGEKTTDEISLYGVPHGNTIERFKEYDTLSSAMESNHPDLVFLQIDPTAYMARQRFLSHKCAVKELEDYDVKAIEQIDPTKPISWEETVVNLVVLDMLRQNKVHTEIDYTTGFATYQYEFLRDQNMNQKELTKPFVDSISEHIINKNFSQYNLINQALYTSLMGKQKVMLGEMPEILLRQILGNTITIDEMRDLFKFVTQKMEQLDFPITMRDACFHFLPHVFQAPKDLYMTALLKEAFQASEQVVAFVGIHHLNPIQRCWEPPPHGINYTQATTIPERIRGETDEMLIEKQAMMDVMLETKTWGERYISNPFPYLTEDILSINKKDLTQMKSCFLMNLKKYQSFREKSTKKLLPNSKQMDMRLITEKINKSMSLDKLQLEIKDQKIKKLDNDQLIK